MKSILVVDDEEDILELVRYNLSRAGFSVQCATSGEAALKLLQEVTPDLVVLDLMLPGIHGLDLCKRLRENPQTTNLPIIMLTAKGEELDIVTGLERGADDYLTKPFSPRVLVARVKAALRRAGSEIPNDDEVIRVAGITIDPLKHLVRVGERAVQLTFTEFKVLQFLARRAGWVFTRYQIVDAVKGTDYAVTERAVDVQIVGLRRKLGEAGELIETVRGVGYRFREV